MPRQTLEGELIEAARNHGASPPKIANTDPRKGNRNINVSRRIAELDFNPVDIMVLIAKGDNVALGTDEEVRVFDRLRSSTELLSYVAVKPKEAELEEDLGFIPEFIPRRGTELVQLQGDDD